MVVSMGPELIATPYNNDFQVGSSTDPAPAETVIHHSEYIVPNELHGVSLVVATISTASPVMPTPRLLMMGAVVNLIALSMALLMPVA